MRLKPHGSRRLSGGVSGEISGFVSDVSIMGEAGFDDRFASVVGTPADIALTAAEQMFMVKSLLWDGEDVMQAVLSSVSDSIAVSSREAKTSSDVLEIESLEYANSLGSWLLVAVTVLVKSLFSGDLELGREEQRAFLRGTSALSSNDEEASLEA